MSIWLWIFIANLLWLFLVFSVSEKEKANRPLLVLVLCLQAGCSLVPTFFENDYFRYLWEGYVVVQGLNPYLLAPEYFFDRIHSPEMTAVLDRLSYPEWPSVYGPVAQFIFSLCYFAAPGQLWPLKLVALCCMWFTTIKLWQKVSTRSLILFACCPIVIHSFVINMHIDIVAVAFALSALYRKDYWRYVLLALAVSTKVYAIILLPVFLLTSFHWQGLYKSGFWIKLALFGLTCVVLESPFLISGASSYQNLLSAGSAWAFNSPIYYGLHALFGESWTKYALIVLCLSGSMFLWLRQAENNKKILYLFAWCLLCSPVVNAWYLVWLLLFACLYEKQLWPWIAATTVWLSFVTGLQFPGLGLALYQIPLWVLIVEWLLPIAMLIYENNITNKKPLVMGTIKIAAVELR